MNTQILRVSVSVCQVKTESAMKIIHFDTDDIENPLRGGQPYRTYEINKRLARSHDIRIYTASYPGCQRRVSRGKLDYRRLGLSIPGLGLSPHLSFLASMGMALRGQEHDLVVEEYTPPIGFCLLPLWTRKPVVSMVQWYFFRDWERRYKLPFERIMRRVPRWVDYQHFIVQTDKMGDRFRELIPQANIWKIPCGVNDEVFQERAYQGDYALFLGRLDVQHKGLDYLIEAWLLLKREGHHIPLVIAGEGPGRSYLEEKIAEYQLQDYVSLVGRVAGEQKQRLLRECRFMVMPSRQETFGITAMEAMASAKPVVIFDIDHLNEVVQEPWGLVSNNNDSHDFAAKVKRLWDEPGLCESLGSAGFQQANNFRWDHIAKLQEQAYQEIVGIGKKNEN